MDTGIKNLIEASVKLECNIETTAKALIMYHHFMRCIGGATYDLSMVAAAALYLSASVNEQGLDVDTILCVFYSIAHKTTKVLRSYDVRFTLLRETFISVTCIMQRMLEFNFNHRIAHQYLVPFLTLIFERNKNIAAYRNELSNTCIRFLSDFYLNKNCMNYKPEHIAIACIDLSLYIYGLVNDLAMIPVWYQNFSSDVTVEKIKQIKQDVMEFYEICSSTRSKEISSEEEVITIL